MQIEYMFENLGANVVFAITAAFASAFAGLFVSWLTARFKRIERRDKATIDNIVVSAREESKDFDESGLVRALEKLTSQSNLRADAIEDIKKEILAIRSEFSHSPEVENLIAGYHEQALGQARVQFWFSLAAASIGFGWILYVGSNFSMQNYLEVMKTLPGIVMDAVAYLFYRQSSWTRQRATELYDRLRRDRQASEAISLVASIDDTKIRSLVKAQMALHMAGLQSDREGISGILALLDR